MKSIALTGSTGVLGVRLQEYFPNSKFLIYRGDIRDGPAVNKFCLESAGCDAFIHFAALVPKQAVDKNPIEAFDVNVRGTLNVLEGLAQLGDTAPWMYFASSCHVYASSTSPIKEDALIEPFTLYGLTKLQGEQWCKAYARDYGLRICISRLFSFSDPLQPNLYFIPAMIHKIKNASKGSELSIPGVNSTRDFLTVSQILFSIERLFERKFEGVINIGTGTSNHLFTVAKMIADLLGRNDLIIKAKNDIPNFQVADCSYLKSMDIELPNLINTLLIEMTNHAKNV